MKDQDDGEARTLPRDTRLAQAAVQALNDGVPALEATRAAAADLGVDFAAPPYNGPTLADCKRVEPAPYGARLTGMTPLVVVGDMRPSDREMMLRLVSALDECALLMVNGRNGAGAYENAQAVLAEARAVLR